jgi:hypothetical protein
MLEIKIVIEAKELSESINSLAKALIVHGKNEPVNVVPQPIQQPAIPAFVPAAPQQFPTSQPVQSVLPQPMQPIAPAIPAAPVAPVAPQPIPTVAPTYTMEQLAVAATQVNDAGRRQDLVNLLNAFGVQALTQLPKEHYGAFATELRKLGAKI